MGLLRTIVINLSCANIINLSCAIVIDLSCTIIINLSKGIKNTGYIGNIWLLSRIKNKKVKQVSWLPPPTASSYQGQALRVLEKISIFNSIFSQKP